MNNWMNELERLETQDCNRADYLTACEKTDGIEFNEDWILIDVADASSLHIAEGN